MIKDILAFAAGFVAGAVATYIFLKIKNKKKTDGTKPLSFFEAEVPVNTAPKAPEKEKKATSVMEKNKEERKENKNLKFDYDKILNHSGYSEGSEDDDGPYTVNGLDDFEDYEDQGYDTEVWTLYADHVMTRYGVNGEEVVKHPEEIVGKKALNSFGEYGDEEHVYVRNDETLKQYEISTSPYTWDEILEIKGENEEDDTEEEDDAYDPYG